MRMYRKQAEPGTLHDHTKGGFKRRGGNKSVRVSPPKAMVGGMGSYLGSNGKKRSPVREMTSS